MTTEVILVHLLIVLVAARVAAELAERAGQAAVLLEILFYQETVDGSESGMLRTYSTEERAK